MDIPEMTPSQYAEFCAKNSKIGKMLKNVGSIKDYENMITEITKTEVLNQQRIEFYYNAFDDKISFSKDPAKSIKLRNEGNVLYAKSKTPDDFLNVLRIYNKSIAFAPNKSQELALVYGNRAMVLFHMKYYNECLADINRALCLDYPDKSAGKLLIKKIRCMKIINHPDLWIIYNDCLKWVDELSTNVQKTRQEIRKAFEEEVPPYLILSDTTFRDELLAWMQKTCPNFEKVQIGRKADGGLTLVAAKDIHVGEIIALEKIYTQTLSQPEEYLVCWQCVMMCFNPIPCDGCAAVVYCSESCKAEAWSKHHGFECNIMSAIVGLCKYGQDLNFLIPIRICMLAIKQHGGILPLMKEVYKMSKTTDMKKEHNVVNGNYASESYQSIYYIVNKFPLDDVTWLEHFTKTNMFVYYLATRTTILDKQYEGDYDTVIKQRVPKFVAALILRHSTILETTPAIGTYLSDNMNIVVTAICPLFYNLECSCNPNTLRVMLKNHQILAACDNIKKGQELKFSYHFRVLLGLPMDESNKILEGYFDKPSCGCEICVNKIPHQPPTYRKLIKDPRKLMELMMMEVNLDRIVNTADPREARTVAEFVQQTEELFVQLRPFFAKVPPICNEIVWWKNYVMNLFFRLYKVMYNMSKT